MSVELRFEHPSFTYALVVLADEEERVRIPEQDRWVSCGMVPCGNLRGIGGLLTLVADSSGLWETGWNTCLDAIDDAVRFQVRMKDLESYGYIFWLTLA